MGGVAVIRFVVLELDCQVDWRAIKINMANITATIPKIKILPEFFMVLVIYLASVFLARG